MNVAVLSPSRSRRTIRLLILALVVVAASMLVGVILFVHAVRHRLAEGTARNWLPPMTQPVDRPWDGTVPLCSGATFRVIGLCENSENPHWWNVDGSAIANPPLKPRKIEAPGPLGALVRRPLDRQLCYEIDRPPRSGNEMRLPTLKIDGSSDSLRWSDGSEDTVQGMHDVMRHVFPAPGTSTLTLRGEMNDDNYQTFAISRSGQTTAGPLKVEYAAPEPGWTEITIRGQWQFDARIAVIRRNGHQAFRGFAMGMNLPTGRTLSARFSCPMNDIAAVHFQMCGVQRFVATGIAASAGVAASARIAIEHLNPTLAGRPPLGIAPLPKQERDPTPPIKLPSDEIGKK